MMMRMMMVRRMRVVNFCKLTTSPHETCALECNREREILSLKKRLHAVCHATTRTRAYEHGTFQSKVMSLSVWRHGYDARTDHLWIRVASVQKLSRKTFSLAWWLMIHRENAIGKMFFSLSLPPPYKPPPITLIAFLHTVPCFCFSSVWNMQSAKEKRGFSFCFVLLVFSVEANAADKVYL